MIIVLQTTQGDISLALDFENTPKTAQNFVDYAQAGFYDGLIFHRVIKNFMIQGGGFDENMEKKETYDPIENEAATGQKNAVGTIAMARTSDPHSATSQFFINVADNASLNHHSESPSGWGYCVFGEVIEGLDVVMELSKVKTTVRAGHKDVPVENIVIKKVLIKEEER